MTNRARVVLLLITVLSACAGDRDDGASPGATDDGTAPTVVVGSSPGIELELLAEVYAQAIESAGYPVRREPVSVDAHAIYSELVAGSVDLAPGRIATLLAIGDVVPSGEAAADLAGLRRGLAEDGLSALQPSAATSTTGFGLLDERATELSITRMSELASLPDDLIWGLPEDCPVRPGCEDVLSGAYEIEIRDLKVEPIAACDPAGGLALNDGVVDIALVCTTQPEIERLNLLVLEDDRHAQPSGAFVPVISDELLTGAGAELSHTLDAISGAMTTEDLTSLVARVSVDGEEISDVARSWLEDRGLA